MSRLTLASLAVLVCSLSFSQTLPTRRQSETKSAVRNVRFENSLHLLPEQQEEAERNIQRYGFDQAESFVKEAYANNGYWRPKFSIVTSPVSSALATIDLMVNVTDEGQQYWLRDFHFHGVRAFSEERLLTLFPIRAGDLCKRSAIATGLETVKQIYASHGYLNYTPIPEFDFDDAGARVSITVEVDEGLQFRMGKLIVRDLDQANAARILSAWPIRSGDVFDESKMAEFLKKGVWDIADLKSAATKLHERSGLADVLLGFGEHDVRQE